MAAARLSSPGGVLTSAMSSTPSTQPSRESRATSRSQKSNLGIVTPDRLTPSRTPDTSSVGRPKSSASMVSSRHIPLVRLKAVTDTDLGLAQGVQFKTMDLNGIIKLLEEGGKGDFEEKQLQSIRMMVQCYQNGFPLRDLAHIFKIMSLCSKLIKNQPAYLDIVCDILKLCRLPFLKKKTSDEVTYAKEISGAVPLLGDLLQIPSSELRIQLCKCIVDFYHAEPLKKQIAGYQQVTSAYKIQMIQTGGLAETLVLSWNLLQNELLEKLWLLKTLQHLSTSEVNCNLMIKAQAANKICSCLNNPDPSGQLLFRSSEILWNLLERSSKEEIIKQLSNLKCLLALKEVFKNLFTRGYRHYDRQLRNDILVITTIIAQNPGAPMIESGFTRDLILFATFNEVKSKDPLVKGLKLSNSYEDFELKKLLFNVIVILCRDLPTVQILIEGKTVEALFTYVKKIERHKVIEWSAAQLEELQLHAIATLASVAPLLIDDYLACNGNSRILMFLEWCVNEETFFSQGNSFHGTGGRGNKFAQLRYTLRLLRAMVSLSNEVVNQDLFDQGAIKQLIGILKSAVYTFKEEAIVLEIKSDILLILSCICENHIHRKEAFGTEGVDIVLHLMKVDPKKFQSGLGHNRLLFSTLDCLWCCILGCYTLEDYFLEKEGIFLLLDLLALNKKNFCNLILGIMVEFCDNPKTSVHVNTWRGKKDQTAANLLIKLWREEEKILGVKRDEDGKIIDAKKPLITSFQEDQKIIPMPASCPTTSIMEVSENIRAKIYAVLGKLDFENLPGLSAEDFVTLCVIHRYLDFKIGEIWNEINEEIRVEQFRPVSADKETLEAITEASENIGKMVVALQNEMVESQRNQDMNSEQKDYMKIHATHKQRDMANKSWGKYLARTSNSKALKKTKKLQEKAIESSRAKGQLQNAIVHSTDIKGLNVTVPTSKVVTVESTPVCLLGGPLADTDIALKRLPVRGGALQRVVKTEDKPKEGRHL
ncbi:cilia- and flagella-associated protein 69 isoform X1 [Monodelphis domestica]|uniref:Cilia and flagella associated protein 69 n=1 Tax=Monodelphis domestica TaxID=13616 RepID=F6YSD9_MONDO|nr:cilia- and flagella-associated protein 69 isoform X1 [Monodelphis domestica]